MKSLISTALLFSLAAPFALAQQPGQAQEKPARAAESDDATTIRTYNISDLVRASTDYRLNPIGAQQPGFGAVPGGFVDGPMGAAPPANAHIVSAERIVQLIQSLIEADSWTNNGGTLGQIEITGNLLVIRHTVPVHTKIQDLLNQLRQGASPARVLKISADWIEVPRDVDTSTLANDTAALDQLIKSSYARAKTTCFNGQTVSITSAREQTYVRDSQIIVGTNAAGYDIMPDIARSGVMLQISPQLVPDSEEAVIDLTSIVRKTEGIEPAAPATQPALNFAAGRVDRVKQLNQQLQTTLRAKLGARTVVGGMTIDPSGDNSKQLVLVIRIDAAE